MLAAKKHTTYKDTQTLKVNGWRKIYHADTNGKKAVVVTLISDRADFKAKGSYQG